MYVYKRDHIDNAKYTTLSTKRPLSKSQKITRLAKVYTYSTSIIITMCLFYKWIKVNIFRNE